jgi:sulfur relay (sulfurtransferase) DsrF/TusC family protein
MAKRILITYNRPPFGSTHFSEGLRLASGMGFNEHEVKLIYLGKGARCALKGVDRQPTKQFLETINNFGYPFYVERESLAEGNIPEDEIDSIFKIITRDEVAKMLKEADVTISL